MKKFIAPIVGLTLFITGMIGLYKGDQQKAENKKSRSVNYISIYEAGYLDGAIAIQTSLKTKIVNSDTSINTVSSWPDFWIHKKIDSVKMSFKIIYRK
jgi:hypothetical protein